MTETEIEALVLGFIRGVDIRLSDIDARLKVLEEDRRVLHEGLLKMRESAWGESRDL